MTHNVTAENGGIPITLAPQSLVEEILQNIAMILGTVRNTAPLFRDFGISATFLDKPTVAAESILIGEIYDAIELHEPRAEIVNVFFERDESAGKIVPVLEVIINAR
jgi:hypothetical protein